jgi:hypothetical protein
MSYSLSSRFDYFFSRMNPSPSITSVASSEYQTITGLLESRTGAAAPLNIYCFQQGSYGRATAIHTINDLDIVALCQLQFTMGSSGGLVWTRAIITASAASESVVDSVRQVYS